MSSMSAGHSIESLIADPLAALSKANAMMLSGQAQFILDYCFTCDGGTYSPILIRMSCTECDGHKVYFDMPLIALLPLSSLAIDKAALRFDMQVTSTSSRIPSESTNAAKPHILAKKSKIRARIARPADRDDGKLHSSISVDISARQIPLPKGVRSIIDVYSRSVTTMETL